MAFAIRKTLKVIFLVATTLAIAIALTNYTFGSIKTTGLENGQVIDHKVVDLIETENVIIPSKKVSRFLAAANPPNKGGRNPNAADHCHKDYDVCTLELGANSTCCGNKCFDLITSKNHCGSCHNKCKYTYDCCRGQCVDLAFDKRHCGGCNQKCLDGKYCIYGMCDYA